MIPFHGILMAAALVTGASEDECPMRPPPLDIATMQTSKDVKSIVVDYPKRTANLLLKDGSAVRVINMGCQHSGSIAQSWVMNPPPISDGAAWIKRAEQLAGIAFTPGESKLFDAWASHGQLQKQGEDRLERDGTGYGDLMYSIAVEPIGLGEGAWLTISYSYP
jgi:hypothetical protein